MDDETVSKFQWFWLVELEAIIAVFALLLCLAGLLDTPDGALTNIVLVLFAIALVYRSMASKVFGWEVARSPQAFRAVLWIVIIIGLLMNVWIGRPF